MSFHIKGSEAAIRVTQNSDESVAMGLAYARILESVIMGRAATPAEAVAQCVDALRDSERVQPNALDSTLADALATLKPTAVANLPAAALSLKIN